MTDTLKFIDVHQHLNFDWGCGSIDEIVSLYRAAGRGKICLSACGEQFGQPENAEVAKAFNSHPRDIIGFAYFRLGAPWIQEACSVAAANPNVFFDLSGIIGYICDKPASFFENIFSWNRARAKLVFGVDGPCGRIQETIGGYDRLLENLKFSEKEKHNLFYGHAAEFLNIASRPGKNGSQSECAAT